MYIKDYKIGTILKNIRNHYKMTQQEFSNKINFTRSWLSKKETEIERIYIKDFIKILEKCNFDLFIINVKDNRKISIKEYDPGFILKVVREWTDLGIVEFSETIGKKKSWQSSNELGLTDYYANDLFELAKVNGFELELIFKTKNNN